MSSFSMVLAQVAAGSSMSSGECAAELARLVIANRPAPVSLEALLVVAPSRWIAAVASRRDCPLNLRKLLAGELVGRGYWLV